MTARSATALRSAPSFLPHSGVLMKRYNAFVNAGAIECDPAQLTLIRLLDTLLQSISMGSANGTTGSWHAQSRSKPHQGLYIWGPVGGGKTMLMDLFFEALPIARKRRIHLYAFMRDVHARLYRHRSAPHEKAESDVVHAVAAELADETHVLCFDEFVIADIADAMIIGRLFSKLFAKGVIMVATSNVEPARLYEGGRNRTSFLPFIAAIERAVEIERLDARTDFRTEKQAVEGAYLVPADAAARSAFDSLFVRLTGRPRGEPTSVLSANRSIPVPEAAGPVARVSFAHICGTSLGAADFQAIAEQFEVVIIENIPIISFARREEAIRLMILVDILYDARRALIISADADPPDLYQSQDRNESFLFRRTVSRLLEMRSASYLSGHSLFARALGWVGNEQ